MIVSIVLKNPFQPSLTFLVLCLVKKSLRAGLTKRSPVTGSPTFEGVPSTGTCTQVSETPKLPPSRCRSEAGRGRCAALGAWQQPQRSHNSPALGG